MRRAVSESLSNPHFALPGNQRECMPYRRQSVLVRRAEVPRSTARAVIQPGATRAPERTMNEKRGAMTDDTRRTIVCATDLSEASRCALDTAIELAANFGVSRIHVVYVCERAERIETVEGLVEQAEAREDELHREIAEELAHVKAARGSVPPLDVVSMIRYGKVYREILHYAVEVNADFIVVGTHGRTGLGHTVLGSVAERVARNAACNVVIAKSAEVRAHLADVLRRRASR